MEISVVTPTLNSAETLEETLRSVREQGDVVLEHVVVDGGSTDGTVELLRSAPGVRWMSEPDRGLSHAMNKGLAMARGEVVGWLNADDVYLPGALRSVASAFGEMPEAQWLVGRCLIVGAHGEEIRRPITAYKDWLLRHYSFRAHLTQNFVPAPSTFVRRSAYEQVGPFDERFEYSMDYDMWLRLGRRWPPLVLDRPLAAFRMAEGSLSMTGFERQFREHRQNAREHGTGHAGAVMLNRLISGGIIAAYRMLRARQVARL